MGPVGEALNDDISTNTSERINEALKTVETPVQVPSRLELTTDERAELENFRNMFGRLHERNCSSSLVVSADSLKFVLTNSSNRRLFSSI